MPEDRLKSALEIAMERLRRMDEAEGTTLRPLTEEQKTAIAEVRTFYEAKLAEQEVLHRSALARTVDPAERDALEDSYRRERERLIAERDAKIERIRRGEAAT
jgi:LPS O-antigen subunit length determinant protein (WzzB/FepE family)